jgi:uncharacterized secreted protein with C-terminal beta-propeller domain
MNRKEEILARLRSEGENLEIPRGLEPEWMQETLKAHERKIYIRRGWIYPALTAAACLCLIAGLLLKLNAAGLLFPEEETQPETERVLADTFEPEEEAQEELDVGQQTYEQIYEKLSVCWETDGIEDLEASAREEKLAAETEAAADSISTEASYGKTNVQVENIDEADCIKNDGRYLYQIAYRQEDGKENWGIQILDTEGELRETAFLDDFQRVTEFYVWEDLLIVIEDRTYLSAEECEDVAYVYTEAYSINPYHEITVYDISDRENPQKKRTFTLNGSYETSRIADGYFYEVSCFTAQEGEGETDYKSYIPAVDGRILSAD